MTIRHMDTLAPSSHHRFGKPRVRFRGQRMALPTAEQNRHTPAHDLNRRAGRTIYEANYAAARYCQALPEYFTWNTPPSSAWRK